MPVSKRDLSYIWDMRTTAQEILEFMQGVSQTEFERNNQLRYAVERQLMVIGQRNVLAHDYGEILVERVWLTATKSLPELLARLDQIIPN